MPLEEFKSYMTHELNRSPLTVEAYGRDLDQFIDWLTASRPDTFTPQDVTVNDIRTWLMSLSRNSVNPRSLRRKAQSLRAFFRFLLKRGIISHNPASDVTLPKIPKVLPDLVRADEMEAILRLGENAAAIAPDDEDTLRDNLIIEILYTLGIRRAEAVAISDSDITESSCEIKINGKRSKQRVVPVPQPLMEKIKDWRRMRDSIWPDLTPPVPLLVKKGKRITPHQVYEAVRKELQPCSAKKKSPHALRHTFATAMLNEGADINSVKEFLGHSSLATTQIYTHISFAQMKKEYAAAHPRSRKKKED